MNEYIGYIERIIQIEKEFGCPIDIVIKVLKGNKIFYKNTLYFGSLRYNDYINEFVFDLYTDNKETDFYLKTCDYGKKWFLC